MNWTKEQIVEYMARRKIQGNTLSTEIPDQGPESRLQANCLKYCKEHGWPVYHDWSRKKNQAGWPDLFVFLPEGRMVLIERKAAGGKLRTEQQRLKRTLAWLGHTVHVVRSFKKFLEVCYDSEK